MLPREGRCLIFVSGQDGWVQAAFCIPGARWHRRVRAVPASPAPREHAGALVVALPCRKSRGQVCHCRQMCVCACPRGGEAGRSCACLLALGQGELAMVEQTWEEWDGPDPGYGVNGAPSSLYFWNLEFFGALGERSNSMWCQALSDEKSGRERERKRCWFMDAFMCLFIYTFICVS